VENKLICCGKQLILHSDGIGVYNIYNKVGEPGRPAPSMRGVVDGSRRCSLFIGVDVLEIRCKVTINNYFDTAAGAKKYFWKSLMFHFLTSIWSKRRKIGLLPT
jgi:hypothetical protein